MNRNNFMPLIIPLSTAWNSLQLHSNFVDGQGTGKKACKVEMRYVKCSSCLLFHHGN
jgi:hypothetical protein